MSSCLGGSVSPALHLIRNLLHYSSGVDLCSQAWLIYSPYNLIWRGGEGLWFSSGTTFIIWIAPMRQALASKWHFGHWGNNTVVVFLHQDAPDKFCDAGHAGEVLFNLLLLRSRTQADFTFLINRAYAFSESLRRNLTIKSVLQIVCWPITTNLRWLFCVWWLRGCSVVSGKSKISESTGVFLAEMSQDMTFNSLVNLDLFNITVNSKCRKK